MENNTIGNYNQQLVEPSALPTATLSGARTLSDNAQAVSVDESELEIDQPYSEDQYLNFEFEPEAGTTDDTTDQSDTDADFHLGTFNNLRGTFTWSFAALQTNAETYNAVLSGSSNRIALKTAVDKLKSYIKKRNILDKTPYGIAPKPETYRFQDESGATITKPMLATGSPNDYVSLATYWWPDPINEKGLPYVVIDGKTNPESNAIPDQTLLRNICEDIQFLGLGYFFTRKEAYAEQALNLLKAFFLDKTTQMNPHFKYSQIIQGMNGGFGRATGFVDAEVLTILLDGYQLLQGSKALTAASDVDAGLKDWFRSLWGWMTTNYKEAPKEGTEDFYHYEMMLGIKNAHNNIRSAYELQVLTYAQFIGEDAWVVDEINKIIKDTETSKGLLSNQILPQAGKIEVKDKMGAVKEIAVPAGAMPEELRRTKPATYCQKNLDFLLRLGSLAENAGIDLWNYVTPEGVSIKKAIEAILYFAANPKEWPCTEHEDILNPTIYRIFRQSMRRASGAWPKDEELQKSIQGYLAQLDKLLGANSGYSETSYRQGLDWQILVHKLGYTF
ncbi:alginate lyase family protein [Adhaeribacter radiodurans]|uniref:Alginate lyase family protein n=1 Tax=Adhaeribacter radiodurans TaxID=2745197 RepID=A0A7L7L663_9BACT|nr:alginate lyase family protein [Adhaeribacter radiodurans]QMU28307.1 alginate lyase family protein [Adhaeribacter radiodurans]